MTRFAHAIVTLALLRAAHAQVETVQPGAVLDPARVVTQVRTVQSLHTPLPEQYIWTANDAAVATGEKQLSQLKRDDWKVEPHLFRTGFPLATAPAQATLYIAGPRHTRVWINGTLVADLTFHAGHHMNFGTLSAPVAAALHPGANLIAIEATRGFGSHHHTNARLTSWLNSGEVLAVKILPAAEGVDAPPILQSDASWLSALHATEGWQTAAAAPPGWLPAASLGGIESSPDFFQWNADAGMYNWPGYWGEAPYLANYRLAPVTVTQTPAGTVLDFGRELSGRLVLRSGTARVSMGESLGELLHAPYLGEITLTAPPGGEARGPRTGFRYALVQGTTHADIVAEGIFYPAPQIGTFESNDPQVNRIFDTAAYTAHLALQDSILDGIKRDRGRWIGDNEVIDRVVLDVFGAPRLAGSRLAGSSLVRSGLEDGIGPAPVVDPVNGLPGYSAWWVVAEYEYIERTGDLDQLRGVRTRLEQLLALMARDLDSRNVYAGKGKPFVDWSHGFSTDTPESRRAVHFEYLLAFRKAALLFALLNDTPARNRANTLADAMALAASRFLEDPDGSFGDRWQTNAIAYLADLRWPLKVPDTSIIWPMLKRTVTGRKPTDVITPYYGSYLLETLARIGGGYEALTWMKQFWGGMIDNGATSFWEAWDPAWAGDDPHAKLEADDKVGYNASLAHGWSSGPAAFLLEDILGIKPAEPGYARVQITPRLASLQWMKGAMATPFGAVKVEVSDTRILTVLPNGMRGGVLLPMGTWTMNGVSLDPTRSSTNVTLLGNGELQVTLQQGGTYEFLKQ